MQGIFRSPIVQVPETPSFSVVYDIPTDNYSQRVVHYSLSDEEYASNAITKIVVDNEVFYVNPNPIASGGAGIDISLFTFASFGEHIVDIYTLPNCRYTNYVLGYRTSDDDAKVIPNTKKITISKPECLMGIFSAFDNVHYTGKIAEVREYYLNLASNQRMNCKKYCNGKIYCADGTYLFD